MTTILSSTSLSTNSLIQVIIAAHNSAGWGSYSQPNIDGATMETVPEVLDAPTFNLASSTNTQLVIDWNAPTQGVETGGSSVTITSYTLYWDQGLGTGDYVSLVT